MSPFWGFLELFGRREKSSRTIASPGYSKWTGEVSALGTFYFGDLKGKAVTFFSLIKEFLFSWSQMEHNRPHGFNQHWSGSLWHWRVSFQSFDIGRTPNFFPFFHFFSILFISFFSPHHGPAWTCIHTRQPAPQAKGHCFIPFHTFRS